MPAITSPPWATITTASASTQRRSCRGRVVIRPLSAIVRIVETNQHLLTPPLELGRGAPGTSISEGVAASCNARPSGPGNLCRGYDCQGSCWPKRFGVTMLIELRRRHYLIEPARPEYLTHAVAATHSLGHLQSGSVALSHPDSKTTPRRTGATRAGTGTIRRTRKCVITPGCLWPSWLPLF